MMILKKYWKTFAVVGLVQVCVWSYLLIQVYSSGKLQSFTSHTNSFVPLHNLPENDRQSITKNVPLKEDLDTTMESINVPNWQKRIRKSGVQSGPFFLTAVVRVRLYKEDKAKWTVAEFKQWMHYQFWAGVEHIYVCNHFLNESERIEKPLEKYVKLGLVTILAWNETVAVPGSKTYNKDSAENQNACYHRILKLYRNQSVWQYNFDMDENPYRLDDQKEGFLARYLANLSASESDNQTVEIRLQNFLILGQGDRGRDIFYDRLNRITPKIANGNWKAIYKTQCVDEVGMHGVKTPHRHGQLVIADTAKLKMLHYWGGRIQDWGPDTTKVIGMTVEFNDVRNTIAKSVRHSLMVFNDTAAFSKETGP